MMNIVHIITALGIGGAEKLLVDVANRQAKRHKVHIIYLKNINDLIEALDVSITAKRIPIAFSTIDKISSYCKEVRANVVHTHLSHADFFGILAARKTSAKSFCTLHNIYFRKSLLDILIFKVYRFLFLKVATESQIVAISKSVRKHAIVKLKLPKERTHLLYNAIEEKKKFIEKRQSEKINILFVGRLEKQKSLETLLLAVNHLKQKWSKGFQAIIVGEGRKRSYLESLSKKLDLGSLVNFIGKQGVTDHFYQESHIFVLPSIWEGFGIVILEAFRAKVAVIASNIEGPAELIKNNENGLLFEPKNYKELAEKLKLLIEDTALRERLVKNGYESFTKDYHIETYVERLEKIYINA